MGARNVTHRGATRSARPPAGPPRDRMTRLVDVPSQFDDRSFDQFTSAFAAAAQDGERLLFDAHAAEWASPYGLVGLLVAGAGRAPAERRRSRRCSRRPTQRRRRELLGAGRLLPRGRGAVRDPRPRAQGASRGTRATCCSPSRRCARPKTCTRWSARSSNARPRSSRRSCRLDPKATMGFAMALSEACQNIVEHAGRRRLGGGAELPLAAHAGAARGGDRGRGRRGRFPSFTRADAGDAGSATAGATRPRWRRR